MWFNWTFVAILLVVGALGCAGAGHRASPQDCEPGRVLLDGSCVGQAVADFVICIRSRGNVELAGERAEKFVAEARVVGQGASTAVEVRDVLKAKYGARSTEATEQAIIDRCAQIVAIAPDSGVRAGSTDPRENSIGSPVVSIGGNNTLMDAERYPIGNQPREFGGQFVITSLNTTDLKGKAFLLSGQQAELWFPVQERIAFALQAVVRVDHGCGPGRGRLTLGAAFADETTVAAQFTFDQSDCWSKGGYSLVVSKNGETVARASSHQFESGDVMLVLSRQGEELKILTGTTWELTVPGYVSSKLVRVGLMTDHVPPKWGPHVARLDLR